MVLKISHWSNTCKGSKMKYLMYVTLDGLLLRSLYSCYITAFCYYFVIKYKLLYSIFNLRENCFILQSFFLSSVTQNRVSMNIIKYIEITEQLCICSNCISISQSSDRCVREHHECQCLYNWSWQLEKIRCRTAKWTSSTA
jgi:hypothetical protein